MKYRVKVTLIIRASDQSRAAQHAQRVTDSIVESNVTAGQAYVTTALVTSNPQLVSERGN